MTDFKCHHYPERSEGHESWFYWCREGRFFPGKIFEVPRRRCSGLLQQNTRISQISSSITILRPHAPITAARISLLFRMKAHYRQAPLTPTAPISRIPLIIRGTIPPAGTADWLLPVWYSAFSVFCPACFLSESRSMSLLSYSALFL